MRQDVEKQHSVSILQVIITIIIIIILLVEAGCGKTTFCKHLTACTGPEQ